MKFKELNEEAKQKALEDNSDINTGDFEWWESTTDDAKQIAELMGIDIENIYFSGFSSQGDGACFEGSYEYKKGSVKAVKEYAPLDEELHGIVEELFQIQIPQFFSLSAGVKHRGSYYHENCTDISVSKEIEIGDGSMWYGSPLIEVESNLVHALRRFMQWIYSQLEKQYWFLVGEEAITESLKANDYEFNEDGTRA